MPLDEAMPIELEAKFAVESHEALRGRLREVGAERVGAVLEENWIFDRPDRSLLVADCGLRVRSFVMIDGPARPAALTYKGRRLNGPYKARQEIESEVADPVAVRDLLSALGFVEVLMYEKRRETWRLGECAVELDELPYLGRYIEIEGPGEDAVRWAQNLLGLREAAPIRSSYIALLIQYCQERGLPTRRMVFAGSPAQGGPEVEPPGTAREQGAADER